MILGLIQARTSSTRLPGKVLLPLLGEPMLFRQIERLRDSRRVQNWVVVTSDDDSDAGLRAACQQRGIAIFAGSLGDVLDRFYQAALASAPEHVVRITGDCPLIDPEIVDQLVDLHLSGNFDYSSSAISPSFPDGLDCEIFRGKLLTQAWQEASLPSQREHVTPFMYSGYPDHPAFKVGSLRGAKDLSALRWTVDEPRDFQFVTKIYEGLYPTNPKFRTQHILDFLAKNPGLAETNSAIERNEGYKKSLARDPGKKSK